MSVTPTPSSSALRGSLFSGLRWTGSSQIFQQIINLAWSVVMAHMLQPSDFGLLAMASVFTGFIYFVLDMGLSVAVVQRENLEESQLSSIFWLNVFVGLVMTLLGSACSLPIAVLYRQPGVQMVVVLLSFNFLLYSLSITQVSLLQRRMEFRTLELRTLGGLVIGSVVSIILGLLGFGVWSLVARLLVSSVVGLVLLWSVSGWRPTWTFQWSQAREFVGFSSEVLGSSLLGHIGRNADNLLIGRFVGASALGYYSLAYNLMMLPVQRFTQVMVNVLFPALSRLQEDTEKLARSWFRAARLITTITAPLMFGLVVLSDGFVTVVYGEHWMKAVPILRILALLGVVQSLGILDATVLIALGKFRLQLKLVTFSVGVSLVCFAIGLQWGSVGVASCFLMGSLATSTIFLLKTLSLLKVRYSAYLRNLAGVLSCALGMALALLTLRTFVSIHSTFGLLGAIGGGAVIYLGLLRWFDPGVLVEFLNILPEKFTRRLPSLGLPRTL